MALKSLKKLKNLKNKVVWLRVDFNVPTKAGKITEDYKIKAGLETINFLRDKKCKIIIATHWGEPQGRYLVAYSTKPLAQRLQKLLGAPVKFIAAVNGPKLELAISKMAPGEVLFLENLRFNKGELTDDSKFAKELSQGANLYVNDAFAVSHRAQASVSAIKKYLPSYAGLLLEQEILSLNKILRPQKPLVVILGGSKISTKLPLISSLYKKADQIILGGGLANNFFKWQKLNIGQSIYEAGVDQEIKKFFSGKTLDPKIILPLDIISGQKGKKPRARSIKDLKNLKAKEAILDIGPDSISLFATYIKKAKTIIWNGPMGKFELDSFKHGTLSIARLVASKAKGPAYGVVGGGETVAALKLTKMQDYVDWVSTAGGAMLVYLSGKKMPGLEKII